METRSWFLYSFEDSLTRKMHYSCGLTWNINRDSFHVDTDMDGTIVPETGLGMVKEIEFDRRPSNFIHFRLKPPKQDLVATGSLVEAGPLRLLSFNFWEWGENQEFYRLIEPAARRHNISLPPW